MRLATYYAVCDLVLIGECYWAVTAIFLAFVDS